MIKSSRHPLKYSNYKKKDILEKFIKEMNRVKDLMLQHVWDQGIEWRDKKGIPKLCCPSKSYFDIPSYFDAKQIPLDTNLSARALSSLTSQVCGMLKAATKKHTKRLFILGKLKDAKEIEKLKSKIEKNPPVKPFVTKSQPLELSSKCAVFIPSITEIPTEEKFFGGFVKLQSLGKEYGIFYLPIKCHQHSDRLKSQGKLKGSFLISTTQIDLRWEIKTPAMKLKGLIVGADTGKRNLVTLSTDPKRPNHPHGHTLDSLIERLSRKKRGSKGFERTKRHLDNYTRWYVRQLDFTNIKQLNLEKVRDIKRGRRLPKNLIHWSNPVIEKAIVSKCNLEGVLLKLQDSTYRSQRCSSCGLVRKSNRKGKDYICAGCDFRCDSDLNAAKNHEPDLFPLPKGFRQLKKNLGEGFYWLPSGIFLKGQEHRIPDTQKVGQ